MKSVGAEQAPLRVLPAHQGLEARSVARSSSDTIGLVMQAELVALEGPAQVGLDLRGGPTARARIVVSNTSQRDLPLALARYIAVSASRSRSSGPP